MKSKWLIVLVGTLLLVGGAAVWRVRALNGQEATQIVRRWLAAEPTVSYTGSVRTEFRLGNRLVVSNALVARRPHMRRIHYVTPPLDGVTIWQDHQQTFSFEPHRRQLEIYDRSLHRHGEADKEESLVLKNYQPRLEGIETIAGRPAYQIRLAPRHPGDAWKRIWIDRATYLRLGTNAYDGSDRLLRSTRFTQISFDALPEDQFRPPKSVLRDARLTYSDEAQSKSVAQVSRALGFPIKLPRYVPSGYVLDGAYTYPCQCGCNQPAAQVRWSNGLNSISMFQCGHPCGRGAACTFTPNRRSVRVQTSTGSESFLFLGDTSRAELDRMAHSLTLASAAHAPAHHTAPTRRAAR